MSRNSSAASFPEPRAAAIVVAGGSGRRMGGVEGTRKQYLDLDGSPVLHRAIVPFLDHPRIRSVVVVVPADDLHAPPPWLAALPVTLVEGGAERGDSVWNGLSALGDDVELVLIHDGARPFVTRAIIDRVLAGSVASGALAAIPTTDTIKEVDPRGRVVRTADRSAHWQAQTPQGFPLDVLRAAYERARREGRSGTDDASLCEEAGVPVFVVEGSKENIKITTPFDLVIAHAIAARHREGESDPGGS